MRIRSWTVRSGDGAYEFTLESAGDRRREGVWALMVVGRLDAWLQDPIAELSLSEIDRALGGVRPWAPTPHLLSEYHRGLKERFREALTSRRLHVTERRLKYEPRARQRKEERDERDPEAIRDERYLSLRVQAPNGEVVALDEEFLLVKPDGSSERTRLSGGRFHRDSVASGRYRAIFKHLQDARWGAPTIYCGEDAGMRVVTIGIEPGTELSVKIYSWAHPLDAEPVCQLRVKVENGEANASWRHTQVLGEPARGEYVFEAELENHWISSGVLRVEPHPLSDLRGVKERLLQLSYECGAPGPEETPELEQALKEFQASFGFPDPSGRADPATLEALEELI